MGGVDIGRAKGEAGERRSGRCQLPKPGGRAVVSMRCHQFQRGIFDPEEDSRRTACTGAPVRGPAEQSLIGLGASRDIGAEQDEMVEGVYH